MAFIPSKKIIEKKEDNLNFLKEEVEFLIAKLSDVDFKGREVEILYGILIKLQEQYKRLQ
tara:strand:+ start:560 stop:739 length:180 start_codon:yes stop_codon:yes gene_type:complete